MTDTSTYPANLGPAGRIVWDMAAAAHTEGYWSKVWPWDTRGIFYQSNKVQEMLAAIRAMPKGHISIGGISYGGGAAVFADRAEADLKAAGVL